jgi:hypothetical protein
VLYQLSYIGHKSLIVQAVVRAKLIAQTSSRFGMHTSGLRQTTFRKVFLWSVVLKSVAPLRFPLPRGPRWPHEWLKSTIAQLSYLELAKGFEPPTL